MYRLLQRAAELDETFAKTAEFSIDSKGHLEAEFADITQAIHIVQTEMGITGTTALEAGRTISGSVGSMKAAWTNLVTGFANGNADIELLIEDLVTTIVGDGTENNLGVIGNVLPAIETALGSIAKLIEGAAPKIIEILPGLVTQIVPSLISAATGMVNAVIAVLPDLLNTVVDALIQNAPALITAAIGLVQSLIQGIQDNYQILVDGAIQIVTQLATGILNMLPQIVALGLDLIVSLANGIAESLPTLIPTIIDVVLQIVNTLTNPETLINIVDAAVDIILALVQGLIGAIPELIRAVPKIIESIVTVIIAELPTIVSAAIDIVFALINGLIGAIPELVAAIPNLIIGIVNGLLNNLDKIILAAPKIILSLITGLIGAIPQLVMAIPKVIMSIVKTFMDYDWSSLGKNIVQGLKDGIAKMWSNLKNWFRNLFGDLIGIAKKILGIASPSKVFKKIGGFTAEGFGAGFEDEFAHVKDDMEDALSFDDASVGINASIRKVGAGDAGGAFGGTSIGNININIDGAKYSDEQSLASAIALEIQNMTDRRAAVYA